MVQLQKERRSRRSAIPIEAPRNPAPTWERGESSRKRERAITGVDLAEAQEREDSRQRRRQQRERELEEEQDQEVNFLDIDEIVEEVDLSQHYPPTSYATPPPPEYSQVTRYATPDAPEYSQLTQPLQLGSRPPTPGCSSHSTTNPRSFGRAGLPQEDRVVPGAATEREGVVRGAATEKPKRGRKPKLKTEEQQRAESLKAAAKAA